MVNGAGSIMVVGAVVAGRTGEMSRDETCKGGVQGKDGGNRRQKWGSVCVLEGHKVNGLLVSENMGRLDTDNVSVFCVSSFYLGKAQFIGK